MKASKLQQRLNLRIEAWEALPKEPTSGLSVNQTKHGQHKPGSLKKSGKGR